MFKQINEDCQVNPVYIGYFVKCSVSWHIGNSHKTYETICKLHTAWKQWEAAREAEICMNYPAENDRVYETLKKDDPLKIFQDPQVMPCFFCKNSNTNTFTQPFRSWLVTWNWCVHIMIFYHLRMTQFNRVGYEHAFQFIIQAPIRLFVFAVVPVRCIKFL